MTAQPTASYSGVLRHRGFRGLLVAEVLSVVGDRLAAVALTVLVLRETGSATLAGATYAATLLPWLFSGFALSAVADRHDRRAVMVAADLGRAGLVALMLVPGVPVWALLVLLALTGLLAPPFEAARAAVLPSMLEGEAYAVGSALSMTAAMAAQLVGLAVAGAVVTGIGVEGTLALDAVSFVASALLVLRAVPRSTGSVPAERPTYRSDVAQGLRTVFGDVRLRNLLVTAWLVACVLVVPEGLAVALVADDGLPDVWVGVLMAAVPAGMAAGAALLGRWVPAAGRVRALLPLALLAAAPLLLTPFAPSPWLLLPLWFVAGLGGAYQMAANVLFMTLVPDEQRARAFGVAQSGLLALQGFALLAAGAVADAWSPGTAVAAAGVVGVVAVVATAARWPSAQLEAAAGAPAAEPAVAAT